MTRVILGAVIAVSVILAGAMPANAATTGLGENEDGDFFGYAGAVGDFNGDHFADVAVSAPGEAPRSEPRSGAVFVFRGGPFGLDPWLALDQAGLGANEDGDLFGYALAAGDFDGDGDDDLAVGAPGEAIGNLQQAGAVFVFRGSSSNLAPWAILDQSHLGAVEAEDLFGYALAAGDFDGDGDDDLAAGAPGESPANDPRSGYVFAFAGTPDGLQPWNAFGQAGLDNNEVGDQFGYSLASGDFDGDRRDDLAVGAPGEAPGGDPSSGAVFVFHGATAGLTSWAGLTQLGLDINEFGDHFGLALASGDFDGDGIDDLSVGAPGEARGADPASGAVFLYHGTLGGLAAWRLFGQEGLGANELDDQFGSALATGDFDADHKSDLVVGAPGEAPYSDPKSGAVFAFRGAASGVTPLRVLTESGVEANEWGDGFGNALAVADFNQDMFGEVLVGAPTEAPWADPRSGMAFQFLWSGRDLLSSGGIDQEYSAHRLFLPLAVQ